MSVNKKSKFIPVSNDHVKKVSPKGFRNIFSAISKKIFSKVHRTEVEYGQTLTKKRRKNCVLKSVSSLSCPEDVGDFLVHSPYHINFQFSKEDSNFRGSVLNFQKIDLKESCCEKCFCTMRKGDSFSRFSISSDSACDVSSESSCDDLECEYRKSIPMPVKRIKKESPVTKSIERTLENFIRLHSENLKTEVASSTYCTSAGHEGAYSSFLEWKDEPKYESLVAKVEKLSEDEPGYDILVTKSSWRVVEPSYENLKLIKTFYEAPVIQKSLQSVPKDERNRDLVQSNKTYDEVIESLKLWHLNLRYPNECPNCSCCGEKSENEFNHYVEGYESLENDFNNDIEEFCC